MIDQVRSISNRECFLQCKKIVVEFPASFYNPKFSSGSLTPVAAISGAAISLFQNDDNSRVIPVYPTVWNGGKKKEKTAELIQELIGIPSDWHFDDVPTRQSDFEHVIDAIGMAYWYSDKEYFEKQTEESMYMTTTIRKKKNKKTSLHYNKK